MDDDELTRAIAKMSADYAAQLPRTLTQMEAIWHRIAADELPLSQLQDLARLAHGIAGSGATFGLAGVSRTARELEIFLDRLLEQSGAPSQAERETVRTLLAAVSKAAVQQ